MPLAVSAILEFKSEGVWLMGIVAKTINFLTISLAEFSIAEFVLTKASEIGTGKLWIEIKKQLPKKSLEIQLYDAIEASVINFSKLNDKEQIAPACEIIYGKWLHKGHLSENDVKEALAYLNSRYIAKRNVEVWYGLFYDELCRKERYNLYHWFMLRTARISDEDSRQRDVKMMSKINRIFDTVMRGSEAKEEAKHKYRNMLIGQVHQPILGEQFCLKDIYMSLQGKLKIVESLDEPFAVKTSVVDTTDYLWEWYAHKEGGLLLLHGTPGSGKSSLVKMLAATLATETDGLIVFIDLFRLHFSDRTDAFEVVERYIKDKAPWFFDETILGKRLLILDGLDEIRYKPYDSALNLLRGLGQNSWDVTYLTILSGRTQVVNFLSDKTGAYELELLPLYFQQHLVDVNVAKNSVGSKYIDGDLRKIYWDKLMNVFDVELEMPIEDDQFDELSDSPLLLFLVVWTLVHTGVEFKDLNSTADLYDAIFKHIYTRSYSRDLVKDRCDFDRKEYKDYQQMLRYLGGSAFVKGDRRTVSAKDIYDYCEIMDAIELCKEWIRTHKKDNPSKLVLLFFLREEQDKMNWEESEIEFIHQTFYECLAAQAVIELLFWCSQDNQKSVQMLFHLLSHNTLSSKVLDFMVEIIAAGNRRIGDEMVTDETVGMHLNNVMCFYYGKHRFNENEKKRVDAILTRYVVPYSELKSKVENFEENIKRLLKLLTEKTNANCVDLSGFDFSKRYMPDWVFCNADMEGCFMDNCCLSGSYFWNCNLKGASISAAIADQADFRNANLTNADFTSTALAAAVFSNAICTATEFLCAVMEGAYFDGCVLSDVIFSSACLVAANFDNASFKNVDFSYADLTRADLSNVTIEGGTWKKCILEDAKLDGVKLVEFDLDDPECIEMLCEAHLEHADWTGVTEEQRRKLQKQDEAVEEG